MKGNGAAGEVRELSCEHVFEMRIKIKMILKDMVLLLGRPGGIILRTWGIQYCIEHVVEGLYRYEVERFFILPRRLPLLPQMTLRRTRRAWTGGPSTLPP